MLKGYIVRERLGTSVLNIRCVVVTTRSGIRIRDPRRSFRNGPQNIASVKDRCETRWIKEGNYVDQRIKCLTFQFVN